MGYGVSDNDTEPKVTRMLKVKMRCENAKKLAALMAATEPK